MQSRFRRKDLGEEEDEENDVFDYVASEDDDEIDKPETFLDVVNPQDNQFCQDNINQDININNYHHSEFPINHDNKNLNTNFSTDENFKKIINDDNSDNDAVIEKSEKDHLNHRKLRSDTQLMREDPCYVPRSDRYFMHDDRFNYSESENGSVEGNNDLTNQNLSYVNDMKNTKEDSNLSPKIRKGDDKYFEDFDKNPNPIPKATQTRINKLRYLWNENEIKVWTHDKFFEIINEKPNYRSRRRGSSKNSTRTYEYKRNGNPRYDENSFDYPQYNYGYSGDSSKNHQTGRSRRRSNFIRFGDHFYFPNDSRSNHYNHYVSPNISRNSGFEGRQRNTTLRKPRSSRNIYTKKSFSKNDTGDTVKNYDQFYDRFDKISNRNKSSPYLVWRLISTSPQNTATSNKEKLVETCCN